HSNLSVKSFYNIIRFNIFIFFIPLLPSSTLFPYTTLFRSIWMPNSLFWLPTSGIGIFRELSVTSISPPNCSLRLRRERTRPLVRSEEHTSELQSRGHLVCRLLLEKKKKYISQNICINSEYY